MRCPFATWKPISVNHGGAMSEHLGLAIHEQEGNGSLFGYFSNPAAQVSSTFWCSKTGVLEQYLDTDVVSWAQVNGNGSYNSCEFEGFQGEPMTEAQMLTGAALAKWLSGIYGWPIVGPVAHGVRGVTPHCNPDGSPDPSWGNHPCPGVIRLGQIPRLVALAVGTPPSPAPTQEDDMALQMCDPESGKTIATDADGNFYADAGIGDIKITTLGQHPEWHAGQSESGAQNPCVGIVPWKDPQGRWGYAYITKPAGGHGSLGPYSTYHIGRDGTPH